MEPDMPYPPKGGSMRDVDGYSGACQRSFFHWARRCRSAGIVVALFGHSDPGAAGSSRKSHLCSGSSKEDTVVETKPPPHALRGL